MSTETYKRKRPFLFSYERRYDQLFKYPRSSEIKEAFIRYNIYPRINLNKKVNGVTRLRDRKRISYALNDDDDFISTDYVTSISKANRRKGLISKGNLRSYNPTFNTIGRVNSNSKDTISMTDLLKEDQNSMRKFKITRSNKETNDKKATRSEGVRTKPRRGRPSKKANFDEEEVEKDTFDDILFVKGESPDAEDFAQNDIYTVLSHPSDTIKISNKDIRRLTGKHCLLSGKILSKSEPCMKCDMKLFNYIIHKRIQSTNLQTNSLMLDFNDEIEISASLLISKLNIDVEYINRDFFSTKD
ncbi:hypothetical protein ACO0R3_001532 [Hanseniaspora guilliermondii]